MCDFYQNTEIRHTHKPAQKRSSIYSSTGTCPPGQLPAGGMREVSPRKQGEEMRKTKGEKLRNRAEPEALTREVTVPRRDRGWETLPLLPLPRKDPQSVADNGERGKDKGK